jgi:Sec-independent protein translocase protein TatA
MDGIFGVGLAEILIVGLALFVIGGPENTAKWAREMGRWVRKARMAWAEMMAEMERELGPEGKELMDVTRELGKGAREVRNMSPTRRMMNETMRMVETAVDLEAGEEPKPNRPSSSEPKTSTNGKKAYNAWLPPDDKAD